MYLRPNDVKEQAVAGAMAALPLPLLSHVLYPPITHEYSRTLGRSPACTNSRRAPCRTPCDETQTPFERALPPPGIQWFDRARILTNFRPHIGMHKLKIPAGSCGESSIGREIFVIRSLTPEQAPGIALPMPIHDGPRKLTTVCLLFLDNIMHFKIKVNSFYYYLLINF